MPTTSEPKIESDLAFSPEIAAEPNAMPEPALADQDAQIEGIELSRYAEQQGIGTGEVWQLVRLGQLAARTERGKVFVYERAIDDNALTAPVDVAMDSQYNKSLKAETETSALPPLPSTRDLQHTSNLVPQAPAPEIALLLDHLSLAKEEHREIIRLTQDSISRITNMTEQLLAAKDTLLKEREEQLADANDEVKARDEKLATLAQEAAERDAMVTRLRQELEDMEMLNKTLGGN